VIDDDLLHQRQPQSRPALLGREERIEDLALIRVLDARPGVAHRQHHLLRLLVDADLEPSRRRWLSRADHRLARVAQKVDERLPQLSLVGVDLRQAGGDVDRDRHAVLLQLAAPKPHHRGHELAQVLAVEPRSRQPREPQVGLGDLGEAIDLTDDRADEPLRLPAVAAIVVGHLVAEQLGVEADGGQRVANFVRDLRRHPAHGGQPLGANQPLLAFLERARHRVELARQVADLVVRGDAGSSRVVAARQLARPRAQHAERPQGAHREDEHHARDGQPARAQHDRHRQRGLFVVREPLRDEAALAAQRSPHAVQAVGQRREVALELAPCLGVERRRRGAELVRQRPELGGERPDLRLARLEVRAPRRARLFFEVAVDGTNRAVKMLAPHAERQRQVRIGSDARAPSQRGREVVERFPGRVDGAAELEVGLVGDHALAGAVDRHQGDGRVARECEQQHDQRERHLARNPEPHIGLSR